MSKIAANSGTRSRAGTLLSASVFANSRVPSSSPAVSSKSRTIGEERLSITSGPVCSNTANLEQGKRPCGRRLRGFEPVRLYFDPVRRALDDLVDSEHFFDAIAQDIGSQVLYDLPGWPRLVRGRTDLMARFAGYG